MMEAKVPRGPESFDKVTPLAAPPGHSLTNEPGKWPWDRPPQFANPDDAIDFIVAKLDEPAAKDGLLKVMLAGITVEELVSQIAFKGFMEGTFNPDVAELIKPALAIYLVGIADENDIDAQLFVNDEEEEQVTDETFFNILQQRNPVMFRAMNEEINRRKRMEGKVAREQIAATTAPAPAPAENFLNVPQAETQ